MQKWKRERNYYDCMLQKDKPQFRSLFVEYISAVKSQKREKSRKNPGKIIMNWRCGCTMLLWMLYSFFDILWPRYFAIFTNCDLHAYTKKKIVMEQKKKLVFVVRSYLHIDASVVATIKNAWHMHTVHTHTQRVRTENRLNAVDVCGIQV